MHPILMKFGPVTLYSYGLMMALAFIFALSWLARRAPRYKLSQDLISGIGPILVITGVVGGRLGHFLLEEPIEELFSLKFFEVWTGGMVFYVGLIGSCLGCWWYCRKKGASILTFADAAAPTVALGHILGRIGCLLAGCCYGKQCDLPWAIIFTNPESLAPKDIPLHPTQIYEPVGLIVIIGLLLLCEKVFKKRWNGQIFAIYIALYAILRPIVEIYRGDLDRGFIDFGGLYPNEWLSSSTMISICMILFAGFLWWRFKNRPSPATR